MKLPIKKYQYALVDKDNNFHYVDNGNVFSKPWMSFDNGAFYPVLPQHPAEWKAFQVSFEMWGKYWMSKRAYGVPLTFVGDGATIIRSKMILGRGYSEELYLLLLVKNETTGAYDLEVKLQIDFKTFSNNPVGGVKVNAIEGGVLSYLYSRDTQTYELTIDETNSAIQKVLLDGMTFRDSFNYLATESEYADSGFRHIVAAAFINNTGFNVGIEYGSPVFEFVPGVGYYPASNNYLVRPLLQATTFRLYGTINYGGINSDGIGGIYQLRYIIADSTGVITNEVLALKGLPAEEPFTLSIDQTFTLQVGEKIFIEGVNILNAGSGGIVHYLSSDLKLDFDSRNVNTNCFFLRPLDAWKQLVSLMTDGKYTGDSVFFSTHTNIGLTCGDALRNTDRGVVANYKAAMSLEDFFTSYSAIYNLGIKPVNDVLWLEPKGDIFKPDQEIFDLGEVADLTVDCAQEHLASSFKCGYPDQDYDATSASAPGGKYEVNSGQEWLLPTTSVNKILDIASKFRADPTGIEAIRGGLLNKDTTDNEGDKQVFLLNIGEGVVDEDFIANNTTDTSEAMVGAQFLTYQALFGMNFDWLDPVDKNGFVFTSDYQTGTITVNIIVDYGGNTIIANLYQNGVGIASLASIDTDGVKIIQLVASGVVFNAGDVFRVYVIPFDGGTDWSYVGGVFAVDFTTTVYSLRREAYTAITGVIDNTVYNIEELTPHRQLQRWMSFLAAILYQQPTDSITLTHADKNSLLSTTLAGITILESQNEVIGGYLIQALFLPYIFKFRTKVPMTFEALSQMGSGYIKASFNGTPFYGLPLGKLISKPGTQESQQWELLAAPNNLLADILKLSIFGLSITEQEHIMFISDYNPVAWVRYDFTPQSKYHHLDMYDDWSYERFNRYIARPVYFQKWQTSDTIKMQFLVAGIPGLNLFIYDCNGNVIDTLPLVATANTAVPSPFILYQLSYSLSTYTPGRYLFVIRSAAGQNLAVSEWQDIKVNHEKTYLVEYYNTYNKTNMFFNSFGQAMLRFEGIFAIPEPASEFWSYVDEPQDIELLNAIPYERQLLVIGDPYGVPDWMGRKLNIISLLNETFYDNRKMTRDVDAKMEGTFRGGYKYNKYAVELRAAINEYGLSIIATEEETDEDITSFMLNQQAIGMNGEATLDVEITNT